MRVEQVGPYLWRIPPDAAPGMRVPGLVVADEPLMRQIRTDAALAQLANGATLPGIVRAALAMPDIHQGYGLPVGGVVATDLRSGVVSPGAIGFDINCGVRLLRTGLEASALASRLSALVEALYATVPTGVGGRGSVSLDARELGRVMADGAGWAVATARARTSTPSSLRAPFPAPIPRPSQARPSSAVCASSARSAPATTSSRCRSSTRCTTRPSRRGSGCTRVESR